MECNQNNEDKGEIIMIMFKALKSFGLLETVDTVNKRGKGTVNRTYLVNESGNRYALQLIDFNVFKKVNQVIENVDNITHHLRMVKKDYDVYILFGKDKSQHVLVKDSYWRCYKLRDNEEIFNYFENDKMYYEIGRILGNFHKLTADFPVDNLHITIPNYQDTYKYYKEYLKANDECKSDKYLYTWNEFKFIIDREQDLNLINNLINKGEIPLRITHNNVRKGNIIFDRDSYKALYLIGMDAVMPGSLLRDFGEMARYAFNSTKEAEQDLGIVFFRGDRFKDGLRGYLSEVKDIITETELNHLVDAIKIMALEYGIRHLTDYLQDGKNFNPDYDTESWDICKNQFKLVQEIESHYDELIGIVQEVVKEIIK